MSTMLKPTWVSSQHSLVYFLLYLRFNYFYFFSDIIFSAKLKLGAVG
jgi:hypothetical protein